MQAVAEFVEQRAGVVERQQRRLAGAGLEKLQTLTMSGRTSPTSFSWSRSEVIQAPLCLEARAK